MKPIYTILSKITPYFVLSCINFGSIMVLSYFVLKVPIAGSFALLAVFRGEAYSLAGPDKHGRFSTVQKYCFWILALCGLALIFSILSAMLHLLGTDGQHVTTVVHKYSALVALLAMIIYAGARKRD